MGKPRTVEQIRDWIRETEAISEKSPAEQAAYRIKAAKRKAEDEAWDKARRDGVPIPKTMAEVKADIRANIEKLALEDKAIKSKGWQTTAEAVAKAEADAKAKEAWKVKADAAKKAEADRQAKEAWRAKVKASEEKAEAEAKEASKTTVFKPKSPNF